MKIAGRKNDGAWFRTNKFLIALNADDKAALLVTFTTNFANQAQAAFAEVQSLAATCGINVGAAGVSTADQWVSQMLQVGIPRQVWYGKYTFMTYSKVAGKYVPDFGPQLFAFSVILRRFFKNYIFALRNWNDQTDLGGLGANNPGGLPNANKNS